MIFDEKELKEFARKINILIDLFNKDREMSLVDLQIDFNGDDWFIMMAMIAMINEKPETPISHITDEQLQDMFEEHICAQCGKLIKRGDDYFLFDMIGCFCEKCNNQIIEQSKYE